MDISLGAESGFDIGRQITPHVKSVILISSRNEDDYTEARVATLVARATPPQEVFAAVAGEVGRLLAVDFAILVRTTRRAHWRWSAPGPGWARKRL